MVKSLNKMNRNTIYIDIKAPQLLKKELSVNYNNGEENDYNM